MIRHLHTLMDAAPAIIAAIMFLALVDPITAGIAAVWTNEIEMGGGK
jgi:hypothetical protein